MDEGRRTFLKGVGAGAAAVVGAGSVLYDRSKTVWDVDQDYHRLQHALHTYDDAVPNLQRADRLSVGIDDIALYRGSAVEAARESAGAARDAAELLMEHDQQPVPEDCWNIPDLPTYRLVTAQELTVPLVDTTGHDPAWLEPYADAVEAAVHRAAPGIDITTELHTMDASPRDIAVEDDGCRYQDALDHHYRTHHDGRWTDAPLYFVPSTGRLPGGGHYDGAINACFVEVPEEKWGSTTDYLDRTVHELFHGPFHHPHNAWPDQNIWNNPRAEQHRTTLLDGDTDLTYDTVLAAPAIRCRFRRGTVPEDELNEVFTAHFDTFLTDQVGITLDGYTLKHDTAPEYGYPDIMVYETNVLGGTAQIRLYPRRRGTPAIEQRFFKNTAHTTPHTTPTDTSTPP